MSTHTKTKNNLTLNSSQRNVVNSPLLRLPAELRNRIFTYTFSGYEICLGDDGESGQCRVDYIRPTASGGYVFGALQACRQIFAEARMLSFTLNTFECNNITDVQEWINAMPEQMQAIRSIKATVWVSNISTRHLEEEFEFLALFRGLVAIEVTLWHNDRYNQADGSAGDATARAVIRKMRPQASISLRYSLDR